MAVRSNLGAAGIGAAMLLLLCTGVGAQAEVGASMTVERIEVRGVTVFPAATIALVKSPFEHREVSAAELQSLCALLTKLYADKGYINSSVQLSDQNVAGGVVVLQAVESSLTQIIVRGNMHLADGYVRRRVEQGVNSPVNLPQIEAAARQLQRDPNIQRVDGRLAAGNIPGQSILTLEVQEQPRFSIGVGFDNHHSSAIGEKEGTVVVGLRDLTGWGDTWRGAVAHSRGDTEGSGSFSIPLNARDANLQLYYSRVSAAIIEQPFESLNVTEQTAIYGFTVEAPLFRRGANRLSLLAGFESEHDITRLLGEPTSIDPGAENGKADATVLYAGVQWNLQGGTYVTETKVTYRRGIDAFGATTNSSSIADANFGLEQVQFTFVQRLNAYAWFSGLSDRAQLFVRGGGQFSQDPLLLFEKYSVGGWNTVRGVPENLLVRDNGMTASLEVQLPAPGWRIEPNLHDLVGAVFFDYGRSWDRANTASQFDTTAPFHFVTAGFGALYHPLKGLDAALYWGRAIENNFGSRDNPLHLGQGDLQKHGVHFALSYVYSF